MILHLVTLNLSCHVLDHLASLSRSFCSVLESLVDLTSLYSTQSSANSLALDSMLLPMSLI